MHLAEHPVGVVHGGQRMHGEHRVDSVSPHESDVGQVSLVKLHFHLVAFGQRPGRLEPFGVGVHGDHLGPLTGQDHRVATTTHTQFEDAATLHVSQQSQRALVDDVGAVHHGVTVGDAGGEQCGWCLGVECHGGSGSFAGERLDHFVGFGIAVLHRRALHEVGRRS